MKAFSRSMRRQTPYWLPEESDPLPPLSRMRRDNRQTENTAVAPTLSAAPSPPETSPPVTEPNRQKQALAAAKSRWEDVERIIAAHEALGATRHGRSLERHSGSHQSRLWLRWLMRAAAAVQIVYLVYLVYLLVAPEIRIGPDAEHLEASTVSVGGAGDVFLGQASASATGGPDADAQTALAPPLTSHNASDPALSPRMTASPEPGAHPIAEGPSTPKDPGEGDGSVIAERRVPDASGFATAWTGLRSDLPGKDRDSADAPIGQGPPPAAPIVLAPTNTAPPGLAPGPVPPRSAVIAGPLPSPSSEPARVVPETSVRPAASPPRTALSASPSIPAASRAPVDSRFTEPPPRPVRVVDSSASAVDPRCRAIVLRMQLGEEINHADRSYLKSGCGARS
jgi:hypothetical protein